MNSCRGYIQLKFKSNASSNSKSNVPAPCLALISPSVVMVHQYGDINTKRDSRKNSGKQGNVDKIRGPNSIGRKNVIIGFIVRR